MELLALTLLCGLATYFWRAMAVLLSGRLMLDGELFRWIECVAYAMVAGLMVRIVLLPSGVELTTMSLCDEAMRATHQAFASPDHIQPA